MHSPPNLSLPFEQLTHLSDQGPTNVVPRVQMNQMTIDEYLKTAQQVAEQPWCMMRASEYLRAWCAANSKGVQPQPQPVGWVLDLSSALPVQRDLHLTDEWKRYAFGRPAKVEVNAAKKRKCHSKEGEENAELPPGYE